MKITIENVIDSKISKDGIDILRECLSYTYEKYQYNYKKGRSERVQKTQSLIKSNGQFLTGYIPKVLSFLQSKNIQHELVDNSEYLEATSQPAIKGKTLREDQSRLVDTVLTKQRGVVVSPTGSGKTLLAGSIISCYPKKKSLFLVHTKTLLNQAASDFKEYGLKNITVVGDGSKDLAGNIVVATRQSFINLDLHELADVFDIIIVDECFAKGTKVFTLDGEKEIEKINVGEQVFTQSGINKVKTLYKTKVSLDRIVKVCLSSGKFVYCSKEHLFKTKNDWIKAEDLKGELCEKINPPKKMPHLWEKIQNCKQVLLENLSLFKQREQANVFSNNEKNKFRASRYNFRKNENKQSIPQPTSYRKGEKNERKKRYFTYLGREKRGEWNWPYCIRKIIARFFRGKMEKQSSCSNIFNPPYSERKTKTIWLPNKLQSRCWESEIKNSNRSRWRESPLETGYQKRSKERYKTKRIRVENIEIYKRGSNDESFNSIIGDKERNQGFTEFYDLEIENEHNYFVEEVLAHNCHHISSKDVTYIDILEKSLAPIRIGLTATYPSSEASQMAIEGVLGPIIGEFTEEEAVEKGVIAKTKVIIRKTDFDQRIKDMTKFKNVYHDGIVAHYGYNRFVIKEVKKLVDKGLTVLTMFVELEQGELLKKISDEMGLKSYLINGSTSSEEREKIRKDLNDKKIKSVISSVIWKEGVNVPSLGVVANASGGKSDIAVRQLKGRGGRTTKDKDEMVLVDFFNPSHHHLVNHFGHRVSLYCDLGWM